ncbi:MAG: type II secretion system protein N [Burkholderiales bacterium]
MKRWSLLAVGLAAYAVALIAIAPATLLDAGLQRASDGKLRLAQAEGTLWSGSGLIELRDTNGQTGIAKSIAWQLAPESLLRGHLAGEIELDQSGRRFPVRISMSRIVLTNAETSLPAAVLGVGLPKLAPLGLTGEVLIRVASLTLARDGAQGNATAQWRGAGSTLTSISPLGNFEVRLDAEGKTVHAYLRTIEGPLQLDGEGSWTYGANPAFLGMARIPPQYREELTPLLRLIAVERAEGSFELQLD